MGAGITSDAFHMVAPAADGVRAGRAMTRSLELAGLSPKDVDHVNAHGTATPIGDTAEANAIRVAGCQEAAVYAPKSALGHSIGAVGALESVLTVLTLRDGVIPPTLNYETRTRNRSGHRGGEPATATTNTRSTTRSASVATTWHWPSGATEHDVRRRCGPQRPAKLPDKLGKESSQDP
ncbi:beta-ketoacyl synthase, C-terminal domain protein [Mycobacterium avium subsp. avium 2285 (R)]|nr:beta-ketoacyl synthase, C-terminal domain protein [Mycobacterium avium subsp. avium 2285 (R)]